jgi:hypothetical protein
VKDIGKLIMIGGGVLLLIGFIVWAGGDKLKWFGHLPGDIRIKRPGFSFYMPIASMILVSAILSGLLWIIQKFLK